MTGIVPSIFQYCYFKEQTHEYGLLSGHCLDKHEFYYQTEGGFPGLFQSRHTEHHEIWMLIQHAADQEWTKQACISWWGKWTCTYWFGILLVLVFRSGPLARVGSSIWCPQNQLGATALDGISGTLGSALRTPSVQVPSEHFPWKPLSAPVWWFSWDAARQGQVKGCCLSGGKFCPSHTFPLYF